MSKHAEYEMHKALIKWFTAKHPKARFRSDLSGVKLQMGTIAKMMALNNWPGFPDLVIFEPRGGHVGLALELKAEGNDPYRKDGQLKKSDHLKNQTEWLIHLLKIGFIATFATGLDEAIEIVDDYMNQKDNE